MCLPPSLGCAHDPPLCNRAVRLLCTEREGLTKLKNDYDKTEDDLKAFQSVGQIIGEVLKQLDEDRCKLVPPPHPPPVLTHCRAPLPRALAPPF